jgi:hypothetical protein
MCDVNQIRTYFLADTWTMKSVTSNVLVSIEDQESRRLISFIDETFFFVLCDVPVGLKETINSEI